MGGWSGMSSSKSTEEKLWLDYIHKIPCVLCTHLGLRQSSPTEAHHIKEGQGIAQRASHFLTLALCTDHHTGSNGLHGLGTKGFYLRYKMDEIEVLGMTNATLFKKFLEDHGG
jgi:hypothetical protein